MMQVQKRIRTELLRLIKGQVTEGLVRLQASEWLQSLPDLYTEQNNKQTDHSSKGKRRSYDQWTITHGDQRETELWLNRNVNRSEGEIRTHYGWILTWCYVDFVLEYSPSVPVRLRLFPSVLRPSITFFPTILSFSVPFVPSVSVFAFRHFRLILSAFHIRIRPVFSEFRPRFHDISIIVQL